MKKILVIEDNPQHVADANAYFLQLMLTGEITDTEFIYKKYLKDALPFLGGAQFPQLDWDKSEDYLECPDRMVDGVISDIEFPLNAAHRTPFQIGVGVMCVCRERGIPCILNTSHWHHGETIDWICQLGRRLRWPEIVDGPEVNIGEATQKNWALAWRSLQKEMARQQKPKD